MTTQVEFSKWFIRSFEFLILINLIAVSVMIFTSAAYLAHSILVSRIKHLENEDERKKNT